MKFRTPHKKQSRSTITCPEQGRTRPEFRDECDINTIVKRCMQNGLPLGDPARKALARYGDISQLPDFAEMNQRIIAAREAFMHIPPQIRERFDNDPGIFLNASQTPEGRKLMLELGLAELRDPKSSSSEIPPTPKKPLKKAKNDEETE